MAGHSAEVADQPLTVLGGTAATPTAQFRPHGAVGRPAKGPPPGRPCAARRCSKFLQQIGKAGSTGGSNSETQLGRPAHMQIDEAANELYVADGYLNRRVLVLDSRTGAYKRHWGAYGHRPNDDKQPPYDPKAPLHCVRLSNDGLVYVCDRVNDRIQVFRKDGTFVKEFRVEAQTLVNGSVWDLVLSEDPAQDFIFIADGANNQIVTLKRETGEVLTAWGRAGRMAGQFKWVHNIGIDAKGNLYTAEVGFGRSAWIE
jgi:DNA-binding beta-propeller fold protein YncE